MEGPRDFMKDWNKLLTPLPPPSDENNGPRKINSRPLTHIPCWLSDVNEMDKKQKEAEESKALLSELKGRFKCKACVLSFVSKKTYEKHRRTDEHKKNEAEYRKLHAY